MALIDSRPPLLAPFTDLVVLGAGLHRAVLAPGIGGSIVEFSSRLRDDTVRHWLRPASAQALARRDPLGMASFPLLPWCNRIRDSKSDFGARPVRLRPNFGDSPHAIHGVAWQSAWSLLSADSTSAQMMQLHEPGGWPYRFKAEQHISLDADIGMTINLIVTNLDHAPMPLGVGHHPFLPRRAGARLTASVEAMWQSDDELLPTTLVRTAAVEALQHGVLVDEIDLDNNFTGWSRTATVEWPDTGAALRLEAEAPLDSFVVYSPRGADHFCIEPVSNCTDWMNLALRGERRAGGRFLAPGERMNARFWLKPNCPPQDN